MNRNVIRFPTTLGAAIVIATAGACSDGTPPVTTQVVARVNDVEITASQLRLAVASKGDAEPTVETTRQALEGLVNEQLLIDAALRNKLDRDPVVVQALEAARRQLLARAYLERMVIPRQEITAAEQTAYYKANPALFAQRRVYQLTAYTMPSAALTDDIRKALDGESTPDGVGAVLTAHRVEHEVQTLTRAAEQLPLPQLPLFAAAEIGDVVVQPADGARTTLMLVTGLQASPIGFESAQPIIQQYLANVRNAEALDAHLKEARAAASIEHLDASLRAMVEPEPVAPPAVDAQESRIQSGAAVLN